MLSSEKRAAFLYRFERGMPWREGGKGPLACRQGRRSPVEPQQDSFPEAGGRQDDTAIVRIEGRWHGRGKSSASGTCFVAQDAEVDMAGLSYESHLH